MTVVAIVGRPNVGKSTLFNRLAGKRLAIVEDVPGVTRDRNYAEVRWGERRFSLVDTGGLDFEAEDEIGARARGQAQQAVDEADVILFLVDAHQGLLPADEDIARFLRRRARDVLLVANKVDGPRWEAAALEFHASGFDQVFAVSAEHGKGLDELVDALEARIPASEESEVAEDQPIRVAVLGRPNVGKSSLINRILGRDRLVVSSVAGTTRDPIMTPLRVQGKRYELVDTAGIRRKGRVSVGVELWSVLRAIRAIERAHVCVLLVDAAEGMTDQDSRILNLILKGGRGAILCLNKWDLVEKDEKTYDRMVRDIREHLGPSGHIPILSLSALTGQRVSRIFEEVDAVYSRWSVRVSTPEANAFLEECLRAQPPPVVAGKRTRIYYMTQVASGPPLFAAFASYPEGIPVSYERYLVNRLRDTFGFAGVPVTIRFRKRERPDG